MIRLLFVSVLILCVHAHNSVFKPIGPANPYDMVKYHLVLEQQNVKKFLDMFNSISNPDSPLYGQYMTRETIMSYLAAPTSIRSDVMAYMKKNNVLCEELGDVVQCVDYVYNINRMFKTNMTIYSNIQEIANNKYIRSATNYIVPKELENKILFINGLSNKLNPTKFNPRISKQVKGADAGYFGRESALKMYNMGNATIQSNTSICAIEFQAGGWTQSDINQSDILNGLAPRNVVESYGNNLGGDMETSLDMDMMGDMIQNVNLWYGNYDGWIYDFALDIFNRDDKPTVLSLSYGWAEWDQCSVVSCDNITASQYVDRSNIELAKLGSLGLTVVVASGDAGSPGRTDESCGTQNPINPIFPGSSPYVLSVGATYVLQGGNTTDWQTPLCTQNGCVSGNQSAVINFENVGWTTGGGFGIYDSESTPDWQQKYVTDYLNSGVYLPKNPFNRNGRGYPDLSATGHNCAIVMGSLLPVDGTSCSCPVVASFISLLNDHQIQRGKPTLGFVNPLLYKMAENGVFTQPLGGNTYCTEEMCCPEDWGFQTPSNINQVLWNPVTGLGHMDVGKAIAYLDKNF